MAKNLRTRRIGVISAAVFAVIGWLLLNPASFAPVVIVSGAEQSSENHAEPSSDKPVSDAELSSDKLLATSVLEKLAVKGRAPKTGYSREEFYNNWPTIDGCNLRQRIIKREFGDSAKLDSDNGCTVLSGAYLEPYTGEYKVFDSKTEISKGIQIDHVVALSDAWQKGAQYMTKETRYAMATDPLNLVAVDSAANQQKSDGDAATWLPKNKSFRCEYVARQVSVKYKYDLWVTEAEKSAISRILSTCPNEPAIGVELR